MRILGWDVCLDAYRHPWRSGWVGCHAFRAAESKTLCLDLTVPWLVHLALSLYKPRINPIPMMYVDVSGTIGVPSSLGKHAPEAVLDALIKIAEARHWECGVGAGILVECDKDRDTPCP